MKIVVLIIVLINFASLYAQSKKENLELLKTENDSLILIIGNERTYNKNKSNEIKRELDSLNLLLINYGKELNILRNDSIQLTLENELQSSQLSSQILEFNNNTDTIEKIKNELNEKNNSLKQLIQNEANSVSKKTNIISQNNTNLTLNHIDANCGIRTDRFDEILHIINESDFKSLDDSFDEKLIKIHVSELKNKNGSEIDITINGDKVFHNNIPFNGVAFTNNDFFSNGIWKKKGMYTEFHDGIQNGKTVYYYGDGKVESINYRGGGPKKLFDNYGNVILISNSFDMARIEYNKNGKVSSKMSYFESFDPEYPSAHSVVTEVYDINGDLSEKTVYHCNKWPLLKSKFNRNFTQSTGYYTETEDWIKETEPYLHKYYYVKKESKTNFIIQKGIIYRYIKENGQIIEIKDSIWKIKNETIEFSLKLSLESLTKNESLENIGEIRNGIYNYKNPDGIEIIKGQFSNNNMVGTWKFLYQDGTLRCVANFKNGFLSGQFKYYDRSGKISLEGQYNDSLMPFYLKNNLGDYFDPEKISFPQEGREGVFTRYHETNQNGKMKYVETWTNGELIGPYAVYQNEVLLEKGVKP
jgi:antitoxin component YwqK of YwqJK toxin-antitoxin module